MRERRPQEILTIANHIFGKNQLSLAKFLFITAHEDDPSLDIHDVGGFMRHVLERIDLTRDLHFQTRTTIDTLDYTGTGLNEGSKVAIAAAGERRRELWSSLPQGVQLARPFDAHRFVMPGVVAASGPAYTEEETTLREVGAWARELEKEGLSGVPLIVLCDDAAFTAASLDNFVWVTFTRSNPSHDVHGVGAFTEHKHWGCRGPLIIDARGKPFHAPPLTPDPAVESQVDRLGEKGASLYGVI